MLSTGRSVQIEVAAALPDRQLVVTVHLAEGATVAEAVAEAELAKKLPGLEVDWSRVGIFGKRVRAEQVLTDGDRVEIYRPLKADPKEVRRQLAELERAGKNRPG